MPLSSDKEVLRLKLSSIPVGDLRYFAQNLGINSTGKGAELIKKILDESIGESTIDSFIKQRFAKCIEERRRLIPDYDLKGELDKVKEFSWGVVQGQLDQKIQAEYVRKFVRYNELLDGINSKLQDDVTKYVICTWFNHWTTVLIEEHISMHPRVVPTLKNIKGTDIFFGSQPFDLKVTYLPRDYNISSAISNPRKLAVWMYENQGAQRFGADNRLFVVLLDKDNPDRSWKLKRNFPLVFENIDNFFSEEDVSEADEVIFNFNGNTYTAMSKVLLITG